MVMAGNVNAQERIAEEKGLVGYWRFDEGKGNAAKDLSGKGNDGKIHGAQWVKGKYGTALKFDGIDDYVDCGNDKSLNITDAITIMAWVKPSYADRMAIVSKAKSWMFHLKSDEFTTYLYGTTPLQHNLSTGMIFSDEKWRYLSFTYDKNAGGKNLKLFVDGVLNNQYTRPGSLDVTSARLGIGKQLHPPWEYYFDGLIGEVRIYKRALTAKEIENHYKRGKQSYGQDVQKKSVVADVSANFIIRRNVFTNQVGYLPQGAKWFVVESPNKSQGGVAPRKFFIVNADPNLPEYRVFSGKLQRVSGDFGTYYVGDFSGFTKPGKYAIRIKLRGSAYFFSYTFYISKDVYDDAINMGVNLFAVQRCGPSSTGYNTPCHCDDAIRRDNGEFLDLVGGWHNSMDLRKWFDVSLVCMQGLLNTAKLTHDAKLKVRIYEEIQWGNLYFHKLQDEAGYVYSNGVGGSKERDNNWTDNIRGTGDDRLGTWGRPGNLGIQHAFIWAQALVAQVYGELDPDYANLCLNRAERCFEWVRAKNSAPDYYGTGTGISAGVQMFLATKDERYKEYAVKMAEEFMSLQEQGWVKNQQEVRGFFYKNPERKEGAFLNLSNNLPLIAFCEIIDAFGDHPKAELWRKALEMHCQDYIQVMAGKNAFDLIPRGICLSKPTKAGPFGTGIITRNRKINGLGYRYFANAGGGARNCARASLAVALFKAARMLKQPEWAAIAQRQLDWIVGANSFGVSFMIDVGHVNSPNYSHSAYQPATPRIPGFVLQGPFADEYDRPDLMPGHFVSSEPWIIHNAFLVWGLSEAKAYNEVNR